MKNIFISGLVVFILLVMGQPSFAKTETGPFVGDKAIDFTLNDLDGRTVNFSEFRKNRNVLLYFWASWCKDSKNLLETIKKVDKIFDHKHLSILGINTGVRDSIELAKNYRDKYRIEYTLLFDNDSKISNQYMVMGTPRFFLVNREGIIIYSSGQFPENLDMMK